MPIFRFAVVFDNSAISENQSSRKVSWRGYGEDTDRTANLQETVKHNHTVTTALNSGTILLSVIVMTLPEMCCSDTCEEEEW